jgi:hypothetical protein
MKGKGEVGGWVWLDIGGKCGDEWGGLGWCSGQRVPPPTWNDVWEAGNRWNWATTTQHIWDEKMMGFSGLVGVFDCVVVCWAMFCFRRKKGRKLKSRISEWWKSGVMVWCGGVIHFRFRQSWVTAACRWPHCVCLQIHIRICS